MRNERDEILKKAGIPKNGGSYSEWFIKVYDDLDDYELGQSDKIVFGMIDYACRMNNGKCIWHNDTLSKNTGLSVAQINESIKNLEKEKLITKEVKKGNKRTIRVVNDWQDNNFLMMFTSLLKLDRLSINDKFVYSMIYSLAENPDYGYKCRANNSNIARRIGCKSSTTVSNSIKKLEKLKIIKVNKSVNGIREIEVKKTSVKL